MKQILAVEPVTDVKRSSFSHFLPLTGFRNLARSDAPIGGSLIKYGKVQIDPNGGIVLGGFRGGSGNSGNDFAVVRLNPVNGSLDPSFGGGTGMVFTDLGGSDSISDIAIDNAGNIVAVGNSQNSKTGILAFAVVRYQSNGQLDSGFNGSGRFVYAPTGFNSNGLNGVSIDGSGRIVAVGRKAFSPGSIAVLRFNLDGNVDQSFGGTVIIYT